MRWIYELDVAAVILIVLLIVQFYSIKQVKSKSRKLFMILLYDGLACALTDLVGIYTILNAATLPLWVNDITNISYLCCINCIPALYFYYFVSAIEERSFVETKKHWHYFVPVTISLLLILTNPFTKWVFYFDEDFQYRHGFGMTIMYVISLMYLIMVIVLIIRKRKKLTRNQYLSVATYILFTIGAILVQMAIPNLMAVVYALAVSLTMAFNSIQNPLEQLNYTTDVLNRSAMDYAITQHMIARRRCMAFSVKIEDFEAVDTTYGSKFGDMVMREVSDFFKTIRKGGMLFQAHRRQFVFLIDKRELFPESVANAEKIKRRFEQPFVVNGVTVWLKTSIYQLSYPDVFSTSKDVLAVLEYLYNQKQPLSEKVLTIAGFDIIEKIRRSNQIEAVIERAIKNEEFMVHFQPIYSASQKRYVSAEAVVRLFDEDFGFIDPAELIAIAEKNGQMARIGRLVFEEVCRSISADDPRKYGIEKIEINLSMSQCMQPEIADTLYELMDKYNVDFSYIYFVITETVFTASNRTTSEVMNGMAEHGIKFALNGFGSSYSHNSYVVDFPFSIVKLDRDFVQSAEQNERALKMLVHTVNMLWDMGLTVIAGGADTIEDLALLESVGIDLMEGAYFATAMPRTKLVKFLSAGQGDTQKSDAENSDAAALSENDEDIAESELSEENTAPDNTKL